MYPLWERVISTCWTESLWDACFSNRISKLCCRLSCTEFLTSQPEIKWLKESVSFPRDDLRVPDFFFFCFVWPDAMASPGKDNYRMKSYKNKALNPQEMRRRREEEGIQLRKQKREEQVRLAPPLPPQPTAISLDGLLCIPTWSILWIFTFS